MFEDLLFDAVLAYFGLGLAGLGYLLIGTSIYNIREVQRQKIRQLHPYTKQNRYRPHITVIIPVHNASTTIPTCLNSVFQSSYRNKFDVIVLDMGSTDETKKVIREYIAANPKKPLKLIHKSKTTDLLSTINKVIKKTTAIEMILTLDAKHTVNKLTLQRFGRHYNQSAEFNLIGNFEVIAQPTLLNLIEQYICVVSSAYKKLKAPYAANQALPLGTVFRPSLGTEKSKKLILTPKKSVPIHDAKIYKKSSASYSGWLSGFIRAKRIKGVNIMRLKFSYLVESERFFVKCLSIQNVMTSMFLSLIAVTPVAVAYFIFLALAYSQPVWLALTWVLIIISMIWSIWTNDQLSLNTKSRLSFFVPIIPGLLYFVNLTVITLKLILTAKHLPKTNQL